MYRISPNKHSLRVDIHPGEFRRFGEYYRGFSVFLLIFYQFLPILREIFYHKVGVAFIQTGAFICQNTVYMLVYDICANVQPERPTHYPTPHIESNKTHQHTLGTLK